MVNVFQSRDAQRRLLSDATKSAGVSTRIRAAGSTRNGAGCRSRSPSRPTRARLRRCARRRSAAGHAILHGVAKEPPAIGGREILDREPRKHLFIQQPRRVICRQAVFRRQTRADRVELEAAVPRGGTADQRLFGDRLQNALGRRTLGAEVDEPGEQDTACRGRRSWPAIAFVFDERGEIDRRPRGHRRRRARDQPPAMADQPRRRRDPLDPARRHHRPSLRARCRRSGRRAPGWRRESRRARPCRW